MYPRGHLAVPSHWLSNEKLLQKCTLNWAMSRDSSFFHIFSQHRLSCSQPWAYVIQGVLNLVDIKEWSLESKTLALSGCCRRRLDDQRRDDDDQHKRHEERSHVASAWCSHFSLNSTEKGNVKTDMGKISFTWETTRSFGPRSTGIKRNKATNVAVFHRHLELNLVA